jgi:hypothetical protein
MTAAPAAPLATAIGKGRMQSHKVYTRLPRVPVDRGGILEVLAREDP